MPTGNERRLDRCRNSLYLRSPDPSYIPRKEKHWGKGGQIGGSWKRRRGSVETWAGTKTISGDVGAGSRKRRRATTFRPVDGHARDCRTIQRENVAGTSTDTQLGVGSPGLRPLAYVAVGGLDAATRRQERSIVTWCHDMVGTHPIPIRNSVGAGGPRPQ